MAEVSVEVSPASPGYRVRRANKWPIIIILVVFVAAMLALSWALLQRVPEEAQLAGLPDLEPPQVRDPGGIIAPTWLAEAETEASAYGQIPTAPPEPDVDQEPVPEGDVERLAELLQPPQDTAAVAAAERRQEQFLKALDAATEVTVAATATPRMASGSDEAGYGYRRPADQDPVAVQQALAGLTGQQPADPNLRERKARFLEKPPPDFGYSLAQREPPLSATELKVGTVISALLISGINSDLPGLISAQVSRPVRDSLSGRHVLIPAGSRLIGEYDSHVAFGQRRVLVVWRRIQFPDASTLALESMPGVSQAGQSGFSDQVDNHYWRTFGSATLLSIIAAGAQHSQTDDGYQSNGRSPAAGEELAAGLGRSWSDATQEIVERNLNVQPTLRIRPGYRFAVVVNRDLILPPYTAEERES